MSGEAGVAFTTKAPGRKSEKMLPFSGVLCTSTRPQNKDAGTYIGVPTLGGVGGSQANSQAPSTEREALPFGKWRELKSVLVVGGEFSGRAAERIRSAVPGVSITILEAMHTNAALPTLQGRFDLYIYVTSCLRHDIERSAKIAQRKGAAEGYKFPRRSSKLLAAELQYGFGVLQADEG